MRRFAVLDDSLVYENGVYFYAHALVSPESEAATIFRGNKQSIYQHEGEILTFLEEHLEAATELYACEHYLNQEYPRIQDLVSEFICGRTKGLEKLVHRCHVKADQLARETAKLSLHQYKEETRRAFILSPAT